MFQSLQSKSHALLREIRYRGFWKFLKFKYFEHSYRRKFRNMGVVHPDGNFDLEDTNARSVHNDAHPNHASSFYHLKKVFEKTGLPAGKIHLLDIGCGDGRVLNMAMMLQVNEVYGVELDNIAAENAQKNCETMSRNGYKVPWQVEKKDATVYKIPETVNLIYLFNPFGKKTMEAVVANIIEHAQQKKEALFVAYCIPSFPELFTAHACCENIYQTFNVQGDHSDMVIFKINKR